LAWVGYISISSMVALVKMFPTHQIGA
jgi:hypothetical protein